MSGNDSSCSCVWFDEFCSSFDFLKDNVLLKSMFWIGCSLAFDSGTIDCSFRIKGWFVIWKPKGEWIAFKAVINSLIKN